MPHTVWAAQSKGAITLSKFKNLSSHFAKIARTAVKAAIYVRTSTKEQQSSIEEQEALCRAYCAQHSIQVVQVFKEHESGRNDDRQALAAAVTMLQRGKATALVVARIDRLARSAFKYGKLREEFAHNGWLLMSADPSEKEMSDATANDRYITSLIALTAQHAAELSNERVRANFKYRSTVGLSTGPLWGFKSTGLSKMRRYIPATDGSHETLVKILMELDATPVDRYDTLSYRDLCKAYGLMLSNGDLDAKKAKRIWEAWIRGKYQPLVPAAHVLNWRSAHEHYCNDKLEQERSARVGAKTRKPSGGVSGVKK